jgi:hypothetical protein
VERFLGLDFFSELGGCVGRKKLDDSLVRTSMAFANEISARSGLQASEIEVKLKIASEPPGKNWRRYLSGERTLSADAREKIGRKAIRLGWLQRPKGFVSHNAENSFGFIFKGTLEEIRSKLKAQRKQQEAIARAKRNAMVALQKLEEAIDEPKKLGFVFLSSDDYGENLTDKRGEWIDPWDGHTVEELLSDVKKVRQKIEEIGVFFPELELGNPDAPA